MQVNSVKISYRVKAKNVKKVKKEIFLTISYSFLSYTPKKLFLKILCSKIKNF